MSHDEPQEKKRVVIKKKCRRKSRRKRQTVAAVVLLCLILVGLFGFTLFRDVNTVAANLVSAKDSLTKSTKNAEKFDIKSAGQDLKSAERDFIEARRVLARPSIRMLAWLPMLGNNINAVDGLSASGIEATRAGLSLLDAAEAFSSSGKGIDIDYSNGKINLEPFAEALPHIKKARAHLLIAKAEERDISRRFLLPQISKPLKEYSKKIDDLGAIIDRADKVLDVVPSFFGANEKRRYFLAVQNNAELRATGGLIGNYGVFTANKGNLRLSDFDEIHALQKANPPKAVTTDDFRDRYARFRGTSLWLNANMSPDFPAVSSVLMQLYNSGTGDRLDGIVAIDPVGLKYLLEAIGPTRVPTANATVDSENVVKWTLIDAYSVYKKRHERKDFLEDVALAIWRRVVAGDFKDRSALVEKLGQALSDKHLILYSVNSKEQQLFESLGYAATLNKNAGDYLQVIVQNHGANKVDIYLDQEVDYSAIIQSDGAVLSNVTITLINNAPRKGLTPYVAGESPLGAKNGQSNAYLNVYAPGNSQLTECTLDGKPGEPEIGQEKDKSVFSHYLYVPAGEAQTVTFTYINSTSIPLSQSNAPYHLDWQVQPVIREPSFALSVKHPGGYEATSLSSGLALKNNSVTASGLLQKDMIFSFKLLEKEENLLESFRKWLKKPIF